MPSAKTQSESKNRNNNPSDSVGRRVIATILHIVFWLLLLATFALAFQEIQLRTPNAEGLEETTEEVPY